MIRAAPYLGQYKRPPHRERWGGFSICQRKKLPRNVKNVLTIYATGYIIITELPHRVKGGERIDSLEAST